MILFDRPGRARHARARGLPGGRLPAVVRRHGQVGGRDRRRRRASPSSSPAPSTRHRRPAGAGRAGAARGHAGRRGRGGGRCPVSSRSRLHRRRAEIDRLRDAARRRGAPFVIVGGARWSAEARTATARASASATALPVARCVRAARTASTTRRPNYAGDVGIGPNPKLAARVQRGRPPPRDRRRAWAR